MKHLTGLRAALQAQIASDGAGPLFLEGQKDSEVLDLAGMTFPRHLVIKDCTFSQLVLANASLLSLEVRDCTITGPVILDDAVVQGSVVVLSTRCSHLDARSVQVGGDGLVDVELLSEAAATRTDKAAESQGAPGWSTPRAHASSYAYGVNLDSARVGGNLRVSAVPAPSAASPTAFAIRLRGARVGLECSIEGVFLGVDPGGRSIHSGQVEIGDAYTVRALCTGAVDIAMSTLGSLYLAHGRPYITRSAAVPTSTSIGVLRPGDGLPQSGEGAAFPPPAQYLSLTLKSTRIASDANLAGLHASGRVVLDGVVVGGDLLVRADEGFDAPRLGGDDAHEITFSMRDAHVANTFYWYPLKPFAGVVDLRRTTVGILDDSGHDLNSYTRFGGALRAIDKHDEVEMFWRDGQCSVRLDGFSYSSVRGLSGELVPDTAINVWVTQRLEWIASGWSDSSLRDSFSSSPYIQLAAVLEARGYDTAARDVLYEMHRNALRHGPRRSRVHRFGQRGVDAFVGWGYRPLRSLIWAAGVVLLGALVYHQLFETGYIVSTNRDFEGSFSPLRYSIETFVPLLHRSDSWEIRSAGVGWLGMCFSYIEAAVGWAVAVALAFVIGSRIRGERRI